MYVWREAFGDDSMAAAHCRQHYLRADNCLTRTLRGADSSGELILGGEYGENREILQRRFKELHATDLERLRTVARRTLLIGTKVTCLSQACATI